MCVYGWIERSHRPPSRTRGLGPQEGRERKGRERNGRREKKLIDADLKGPTSKGGEEECHIQRWARPARCNDFNFILVISRPIRYLTGLTL